MNNASVPAGVTPAAPTWSVEQARQRLAQHISSSPFFEDAQLTHIVELDIGSSWVAFSVLPPTGVAGEIVYLLSPDHMLSSGRASDFDELMRDLDIAAHPSRLDAATFGNLFVRLRLLARGSVITDPNDPLLALAPEDSIRQDFSPPGLVQDNGTRYRFWIWDALRMQPRFFDVAVASDGTTTF